MITAALAENGRSPWTSMGRRKRRDERRHALAQRPRHVASDDGKGASLPFAAAPAAELVSWLTDLLADAQLDDAGCLVDECGRVEPIAESVRKLAHWLSQAGPTHRQSLFRQIAALRDRLENRSFAWRSGVEFC